MLARFEWQFRRPGTLQSSEQTNRFRQTILVLIISLLAGWLLYHHLVQPAWLQELPPIVGELLNLIESATVLTVGSLSIVVLWRSHRWNKRQARSVTTDDLYRLSPGAFERYVAELFHNKGYKVNVRGRSGDRGVDLELARSDNRRAIVQCKRYRNPIGPEIIRELFGTMIHEGAHHAFLVTTAEISPAAREWAKDKPMTLIDGLTLVRIIESMNGN